jgi:uncharacterized protein involved in exopolysaccharide biosynthesis
MNASIGTGTSNSDEVSLREIVAMLWRKKWLIAGVTFVMGAVAGTAALILPKTYVATVIVAPVSNTPSGGALGGLGALASQFGGLASLAGMAIPGDSRKFESLAILQSEVLTEKYIQDNDLLPILYAPKWDADQHKWKTTNPKKIPTPWTGNVLFKKRIRAVASDAKTGLTTVTISWTDPKLSAKWANDFVKITNEYVRAKAIHTSEANLAYLNEQALKTSEVPIREGIYTLIQSEINKVMMAKGSEEYALRVVDPAVPPERAFSPQLGAWIIFGLLSGLIVSVIIVIYGPDARK